jgi:translation initiation factor 3 subunit J
VKDDWEASESESEKLKNEPAKPKGPVRNKGITKMKIAEKEAEEALRIAEQQALAEQAADPVLRKKLEQSRTVQSDMENARGLFGDAVVSNRELKGPSTSHTSSNHLTSVKTHFFD